MDCVVKSGETAFIKPEGLLLQNGQVVSNWTENCNIEEGANIQIFLAENKPEEKVEQPKKEPKKMPEVQKTEKQEATPEASESTTAHEAVPEPKKELESTTSVPDAPFDVSKLSEAAGGGGMTTIVLAAIAVVGGGAAFKFYKQFSEQKHEQAMKKLELESQSQGTNGAQPPPCQAQNAILETRMAAIEAKLATVEKKSSSFSADFDADELEGRVVKLEKKVKTLSAKS